MFDKSTLQGAYFALVAYGFWGVVPIYFKLLGAVSPWEIVSHRIVWSLVLLALVVTVTRGWAALRVPLRHLAILFATSVLLSINWLTFIWAILHDNIVETSLGYYINPLVSVFLGMVFLRERLRPLQWCAILIAATAIALQLVSYGAVPWIALTLAGSFGLYGLLRKRLNLPSITGLTLEILLVFPFAFGFLAWLQWRGALQFAHATLALDLLLIASGFVTAFPLLCFAAAVTRLSLTAAGMFQYIAPSMSLAIAVFIYHEPFGASRGVTFALIWCALALFSGETLYHQRKAYHHAYSTALPAAAHSAAKQEGLD